MRWQPIARGSAAVTGLAAVGLVLVNIATRPAQEPRHAPDRLDPEAAVETTGALASEIRGAHEDFQLRATNQFLYDDGTSKSLNVEITVKDRGGRDFAMSGREARAGVDHSSLELSGQVHLQASDGFQIETETARYTEDDGLVRAPGAFSFKRGRMEGSGLGMQYDKATDTLSIVAQARITFRDDAGVVTTDVTGGGATLERQAHVLSIAGRVRAFQDGKTIETIRLKARLSDDNELITFMELRGDASVTGRSGGGDSMSATDIDLAYTDDGSSLERITLDGDATVLMPAADAGGPRRFSGDHLVVSMTGGEEMTGLEGRGDVSVELPATVSSPQRVINADEMEATGEGGAGLTALRFSGNVGFRETATGGGSEARMVHSASLQLTMEARTVMRAVFGGGMTFEDEDLTAAAGRAQYDPGGGSLTLDGEDARGAPRVEDSRISVSAEYILLAIDSHVITARGHVETALREEPEGGQLPGFLDRSQAARISAERFTYGGRGGQVVYEGTVQLWQGETIIRSDRLLLDQQTGNLDATGAARATLTLASGTMVGRADSIHYVDSTRSVEYGPQVMEAVSDTGGVSSGDSDVRTSQLIGPMGDLRADRIVLTLDTDSQSLAQLKATGRLFLKVDTRIVRGRRLSHAVAEDRYEFEGMSGAPVTVTQGCDFISGRRLTWFRGTDRMLVDGREDIRTKTRSRGGPCTEQVSF